MTSTTSRDLTALRSAMTGAVIVPGDADYDEARTVWNAAIDRRPAVIAQCTSASRRRRGGRVRDRGAGWRSPSAAAAHSMSGPARGRRRPGDRPEPINGSPSTPRPAGPASAAARCWRPRRGHPGARARRARRASISHTGVGGLTLGGGMGWLTRKHGLTHRQPRLGRGRHSPTAGSVRAAADEQPDLFWALRGGGGNFGVVTEFEFRAAPGRPDGPPRAVLLGRSTRAPRCCGSRASHPRAPARRQRRDRRR